MRDNAWKAVGEKCEILASETETRYKNIRTVFDRYVRTVTPPNELETDDAVACFHLVTNCVY